MRRPSDQALTLHEVLEALGHGGMGEVHRARDPRLGREAAIGAPPEDLDGDRERTSSSLAARAPDQSER